VCGGAYALKHWRPVESGHALDGREDVPVPLPGQSVLRKSRLIRSENGVGWLTGLREGEWFKEWEWPIRMAVERRFQSKEPLFNPTVDRPVDAGRRLDGYEP
jgi:hypothetical protein